MSSIEEKATVWTIVIIALIIFGALFGCRSCDASRCSTLAAEMGLQYHFGMIAGCRVKIAGKYVPLDNVRILEDGKMTVERQ